ncbi:MAG: hypothetical protein IJU61_14625, partial [Victivallales bacterium]|nr:hypothetical protein [Victivallales bacterium]
TDNFAQQFILNLVFHITWPSYAPVNHWMNDYSIFEIQLLAFGHIVPLSSISRQMILPRKAE